MRKSYPGGKRYAFWGRMEFGLVLSSVSPWEMVQKEKGVTRGGYCCKWCKGFWKGKMGSSRFLQITSGNVVLQMVLDEPPERLYNRWVKDRIEFYKRLEPTAPLRDVPLKVDPNPVHRLSFSISNGLGNVSDAIWNIVLANPEKAGPSKSGTSTSSSSSSSEQERQARLAPVQEDHLVHQDVVVSKGRS